MFQAQLLPIALNPRDVVYTPDDVARDVVEFFKPTGRILEPSAGDGAFLKYLPTADWCEIEKGRDFFACHEHYDWIVGNPPYSVITDWLAHSFTIAENVVYVVPLRCPYNSITRLKMVHEYGGIKALFVCEGLERTFQTSVALGAMHFQRGYKGGMFTVFRGKT
jgi:hypothetical protein